MNYVDSFWDVMLGFTIGFTVILFIEWVREYPEPIMSHLAN